MAAWTEADTADLKVLAQEAVGAGDIRGDTIRRAADEIERQARELAAVTAERDRLRERIVTERETCARIAEEPYSNVVQAYGSDEPLEVGRKIAAAIRSGVEDQPHG
jgi:acyl-CoA reductase-like NAD-dependent aldehyde dehydrogenase